MHTLYTLIASWRGHEALEAVSNRVACRFPPEFKDGEAPQTGLGENFRGGGGDLKKSCRAKGMPSPILDDEGVNKYVSSGSSISPV